MRSRSNIWLIAMGMVLLPIPLITWSFFLLRSITGHQDQIQVQMDKTAKVYSLQQSVYGLEDVVSDNFLTSADTSFDDWNRLYSKVWQSSVEIDWKDPLIFDMREALPRIDNLYQRVHRKMYRQKAALSDSVKIERLTGELIDEIHRAAESLGISADKLREHNQKLNQELMADGASIRYIFIIASILVIVAALLALLYRDGRVKYKHLFGLLGRYKANVSAVLENTSDGMCTIDENYKILILNSNFRKLFHYRHQIDLSVGRNLIEHLKPEAQAAWVLAITRSLKGEKFVTEQEFQLPDRMCHVEVSFNPVVIEQTISGIAIHIHETTKQKRHIETANRKAKELEDTIERQTSLMQQILSTTDQGVLVSNEQGEITFQNAIGHEILETAKLNAHLSLWSGIHGVYASDGTTPLQPDELPVERVVRGTMPERLAIVVRNHHHAEGVRYLVTAAPFDVTDPSKGSIIYFKEISETVAAGISETSAPEPRWNLALENISDWAVGMNRERIITFINVPFEKTFSRHKEWIQGKPIDVLIHPDDLLVLEGSDDGIHPIAFRLKCGDDYQHVEATLHRHHGEMVLLGKPIISNLLDTIPDSAPPETPKTPPAVLIRCDRFGVVITIDGEKNLTPSFDPHHLPGQSAFKFFENSLPIQNAIYNALDGQAVSLVTEYAGSAFEVHVAPERDLVGAIIGLAIAFDHTPVKSNLVLS